MIIGRFFPKLSSTKSVSLCWKVFSSNQLYYWIPKTQLTGGFFSSIDYDLNYLRFQEISFTFSIIVSKKFRGKHILTASRKVVYVLVKMIFLPSMVDLNHETKILWKSYYELNAEKIETRKNLRKIFHPERACLTAPLKILMTIFLEFQIRAENIYFQKPSFFSEFAWILTFVFIFLV